ncbi:MAG: hypothetical protein IPM17_11815 [Verrucomicrobia bacterium]|jgi:hypothetical protein|nr:hypothetical protein [Verrucomicrobiota bacterium]
MQKAHSVQLIVFGIAVPLLAYFTRHFSPGTGNTVYLVGFVGGGLCFVWGVLGLIGFRRVWPTMVTLLLTAFGTLPSAVRLWLGDDPAASDRRWAALLATGILVLAVGLIAQISHSVQGTFARSTNV